jgi:hypothetical protein
MKAFNLPEVPWSRPPVSIYFHEVDKGGHFAV